jgi:hypothetical protein
METSEPRASEEASTIRRCGGAFTQTPCSGPTSTSSPRPSLTRSSLLAYALCTRRPRGCCVHTSSPIFAAFFYLEDISCELRNLRSLSNSIGPGRAPWPASTALCTFVSLSSLDVADSTLCSGSLKYDVTIRQQPLHARISAMKISGQNSHRLRVPVTGT